MPVATAPGLERQALRANIALAVAGSIPPRVPNVLCYETDTYYGTAVGQTWPVIMVAPMRYRSDRLYGGITGTKGQSLARPSLYSIRIEDKPGANGVAEGQGQLARSQQDVDALIAAILDYFDHAPNRGLPWTPPGGTMDNYAAVAGEHIGFNYEVLGPVKPSQGGALLIVALGYISVVGQVRPGSAT